MKLNSKLGKRIVVGSVLLILAGLLSLATAPADQPLSKDDITLLLLGSSPSAKIVQMVEQRGVDFPMTADLAKQFHDQGASDDLIAALRKAADKTTAKASTPAPASTAAPSASTTPSANAPPASEPTLEGKPNAPGAPEPAAVPAPVAPVAAPATTPPAPSTPATSPSSDEPVLHGHEAFAPVAPGATAPSPVVASTNEPELHTAPAKQAAPAAPARASSPALKDSSPQEIQHIIQEFAAKEKVFAEARNNYTYHQINKVQEFGPITRLWADLKRSGTPSTTTAANVSKR